MANGGTQPAGWLQDPTGRNELRFFDGTAWTDNASTAWKALTDPVDGPSGTVVTGGAATAMKFRTEITTAPSATVSSAPLKVCPHRATSSASQPGLMRAAGPPRRTATATCVRERGV